MDDLLDDLPHKGLDIILMPNDFYHIFNVWHDLGEQFAEKDDAIKWIDENYEPEKV